MYKQGHREGGRRQTAPGPQGLMGLITPIASKSGGSHDVNKH